MTHIPPSAVIAHFIRHGDTLYKGTGFDLTPTGVKQIEQTATAIASTLNPDSGVVTIWSSPAPRALSSAEVVKKVLAKNGIKSAQIEVVNELRPFDLKDKRKLEALFPHADSLGVTHDQTFALGDEFSGSSADVESRAHVQNRAVTVFEKLKSMALKHSSHQQPVHLIALTHFETLYRLIEDNWAQASVKDGHNIHKGESVTLTFRVNARSGKVSVSGEFRGMHQDNIMFQSTL